MSSTPMSISSSSEEEDYMSSSSDSDGEESYKEQLRNTLFFNQHEALGPIPVNLIKERELESYYPDAMFSLAYFNGKNETKFIFHRLLRGWLTCDFSWILVFEAKIPTVVGELTYVFQSSVCYTFGKFGGLGLVAIRDLELCRLHPTECMFTLEHLSGNTLDDGFIDDTESLLIACSIYATSVYGHQKEIYLSFKDIVSYERIANLADIDLEEEAVEEGMLLANYAYGYKIIYHTYDTDSYDVKKFKALIAFKEDLVEMKPFSVVEIEEQ